MKILTMMIVALTLTACARQQDVARSYGDDALPSAEVTAFQRTDGRLKYANARIDHDANGCAIYQGTAPDGQVRSEPLLDPSGQPICVRR